MSRMIDMNLVHWRPPWANFPHDHEDNMLWGQYMNCAPFPRDNCIILREVMTWNTYHFTILTSIMRSALIIAQPMIFLSAWDCLCNGKPCMQGKGECWDGQRRRPNTERVLPIMVYARNALCVICLWYICHSMILMEVCSHIMLSSMYIRTSISRRNDREFSSEL